MKITNTRFLEHVCTMQVYCDNDVVERRQIVRKWRKITQNLTFFAPQSWEGRPAIFGGICKSTPLPTYWPSLVEIPWLVIYVKK